MMGGNSTARTETEGGHAATKSDKFGETGDFTQTTKTTFAKDLNGGAASSSAGATGLSFDPNATTTTVKTARSIGGHTTHRSQKSTARSMRSTGNKISEKTLSIYNLNESHLKNYRDPNGHYG